MKNNNKERNLQGFATQGAVIIATLQRDKGKATLSDFNRIYTTLGFDRLTRRQYDDLFSHLESESKDFEQVFKDVYKGKLSVDDLPNTVGETLDVTENKLDGILSTYNMTHQQAMGDVREQRKMIKDGSLMGNLINNMTNALADELKDIDTPKYALDGVKLFDKKSKKGEKEPKKVMVVALADWHLGALVDNAETGGYNFELLKSRLATFYSEIQRVAKDQHVDEFHVYHIGDLIEHISMRNVNQAFETEFTMAEQISKGIGLLTEFLNQVGRLGHVKFGCITGNHDRLNGNKKDTIYNDSAMYIALSQLLMLKDAGVFPNVDIMDNRADNYSLNDEVLGKKILVVHGDHENKGNEVKIPSHIKRESIDYLILGHIHTTRIVQEDFSRFQVYVGSPMGANNYSKGLNLPTTSPSQMLMVLTEGIDSPIFQPVFL